VAAPLVLALIVVIVIIGRGTNSPEVTAAVPPNDETHQPAPPAAPVERPAIAPPALPPNEVRGNSAGVPTLPARISPPVPPIAVGPVDLGPGPPAQGVNLLHAANDKLVVIRGYVTRKDGAIRTTSDSSAFTLPAEFPEQYVLEADVIRTSGKNGICFGFTVVGKPLTAVIDGFQRQANRSGLASINGRQTYVDNNQDVRLGAVLTNGRSATIRIEVSKEAVRLAVDQTQIVAWPYDPLAQLRSARGMYGGDLDRLHIWTWDSEYRITRLELIPAQ
jgi:hypothetical protein